MSRNPLHLLKAHPEIADVPDDENAPAPTHVPKSQIKADKRLPTTNAQPAPSVACVLDGPG